MYKRQDYNSRGLSITAVVCQSTMTALLREDALLVNRAVSALSRVWDSQQGGTAFVMEILCPSVLYPTAV